MINLAYCKITHGLAFEICDAFHKDTKAMEEKVAAICTKYSAVKGRYLSCGWAVEGLYFITRPGVGWRAAGGKGHQGYYTPSKTSKLGREILAELQTIKIPQPEELAVKLGCRPFFMAEDGGQYCGSVAINLVGGVFYLEGSQVNMPRGEKFGDGMVRIERADYYAAIDKKDAPANG